MHFWTSWHENRSKFDFLALELNLAHGKANHYNHYFHNSAIGTWKAVNVIYNKINASLYNIPQLADIIFMSVEYNISENSSEHVI